MIAVPYFSRMLACCLWLLPGAVLSVEAPRPERSDRSGLQAWDLLNDYYQADKNNHRWEGTLEENFRKLDSEDQAQGAQAGEFLIALQRQAIADEKNGRAKWMRSMAWGGGATSPARALRIRLAEMLKKSKALPAAVPVAQWILDNERLPDGLAAATAVLEAARHPVGDEALLGILKMGCFWRPAVEMALAEAGTRKVPLEQALVVKWASDPCPSIRVAAITCLKQLGLPEPKAFEPENGFNPALETDLMRTLEMLVEPPGKNSRFGKFKVTEVGDDGEKTVSEEIGWLKERTDQKILLTNWYAENHAIPVNGPEKAEVEFTEMALPEAVDKLVRMRQENSSDTEGSLSKRGFLSAQFEPDALSIPEAVFSAWLWSKGEKALAAKVIFPRLDALSDSRWAGEIMRDLIGGNIHLQMLAVFSYQRDYGETLRLANHLGGPRFDDYRYQARARELAAQLPARAEDFKALQLPPPAEWKTMTAEMTREQQFKYLASRLRLLNCFQWSQPGDVDFHDTQYCKAGILYQNQKENEALIVINPLNEILNLKPAPADLPVLAPFLVDENYLPTFSYWRDFHPDRTLHRVNELIAGVVNTAAMHELTDLDDWQELAPGERELRAGKVVDWAREMSGKARWEIIRLNLERAPGEWHWFNAARFAAKHPGPELMGTLLAGAERFPERKLDIIKLAFRQGGKGVLAVAGPWSQLPDPGIRIYSALSLIRHGTPEQRSGALAVLDKAIQEYDGYDNREVVSAMLSLKDQVVVGLACGVLKNPKLDWSYSGAGLVHHLFLTRHPDALRLLTDLLASRENPRPETGMWQGAEVVRTLTRADDVAEAVAAMRLDYQYEKYAPDAGRVAVREELAKWLTRQYALLSEGQPTPELQPAKGPLSPLRWEIDAP